MFNRREAKKTSPTTENGFVSKGGSMKVFKKIEVIRVPKGVLPTMEIMNSSNESVDGWGTCSTSQVESVKIRLRSGKYSSQWGGLTNKRVMSDRYKSSNEGRGVERALHIEIGNEVGVMTV